MAKYNKRTHGIYRGVLSSETVQSQLASSAIRSALHRDQRKNPFEFDAALCGSYPATSVQLDILEETQQVGGKIASEKILTSDARKRACNELVQDRFISPFGDAGLLQGFEITVNGRALLQRLRPGKDVPDVTLNMLKKFSGFTSRNPFDPATKRDGLTIVKIGRPHWYVYKELRPNLPPCKNGKTWPPTVDWLLEKTAKDRK